MPLASRQQVVVASTFIMEDVTVEEKQGASFPKKSAKKKFKKKATTSSNHIVKKRLPFRLPKQKNEVYVNTKTNFKAYVKKCEEILNSDEKEITIHALGAAVKRASKLAKQLKELHHDTLELDTRTSTVNLIDDLEPINDEADYEIKERQISAIHIRVFRTALIGTLRFEGEKT